MGGELVVDLLHGLDLGLDLFLVKGVQEDLHVLLSVQGHAGRLTRD